MNENSKMKRITITLTPEQLALLSKVSDRNGYETMSRTIRVLVNKYAKKELNKDE
jgi:metal-responsive CopG/Arc/MetJ family transcriptional regulator